MTTRRANFDMGTQPYLLVSPLSGDAGTSPVQRATYAQYQPYSVTMNCPKMSMISPDPLRILAR